MVYICMPGCSYTVVVVVHVCQGWRRHLAARRIARYTPQEAWLLVLWTGTRRVTTLPSVLNEDRSPCADGRFVFDFRSSATDAS